MVSCPRKRASSKLKPGMMARAAGYWIARSSRAMTSLEGRKDRPRRFLDLPGTRSLNPDRSRSYFRRGSGIAASMVAKANGRLAQLVEHCVHIAGVTGSSPVPPTIATSCFDSTFCKGKAPHQQVEISAVTALSQQEVSHGYNPQARSEVASPNPEGRCQTNFAFVPRAQRRRGLGSANGSSG